MEKGYTLVETAFDSLNHLNATMKKNILKSKGITRLSKMKATNLVKALHDNFQKKNYQSWLQIDSKGGADTGTIQGYYRPSSKEESLINQVRLIFL